MNLPISKNETTPRPLPIPPQTETPVPPARSSPPANVQPSAAPRAVDSAARSEPWRILLAVVVTMLALMAAWILRRRAQRRQRSAAAGFPIEDRSLAGRCLCEIEDLLARPSSPEIAAELSRLHRLGLGLRYGVEFSRRQVVQVEHEARRIRRAIEAFERTITRRAKKRM